MATSADIDDDFSCPICMEIIFVDPNTPKSLPCGHACCDVCLKRMVDGDTARSCPECRKPIQISLGDVSEFPTNLRLRNLAEKHLEVLKPVKKSGVSICPDHEDENMYYYCTQCNMLACQVCMNLKHTGAGHTIEDVKDKCAKQQSEIQSNILKARKYIEKAQGAIETLDKIGRKVMHSCEIEEKKIDDFVQARISELLDQSKLLKNELQDAREQELKHIHETKSQIERKLTEATDTKAVALNAVENCTDSEYVAQHTLLVDKMNKFDLTEHTLPLRFISHAGIAGPVFVSNKMNMNVGSVKPKRPREIKLVQTLDEFGAYNVAHSANGLLAVSDYSINEVIIYEKVTNKYERKLNLNLDPSNDNAPRGVAIDPDGRFLVARWSCIEVYSPDGNYLDKIQTAEPGIKETGVRGVTATSDGRILAGDTTRSVITEHDATGNIIKTMKTNILPVFMTLIYDSHIVLSDVMAGKVSVMDMETEQETLSIDIPGVMGICYDEHTDCLLIAKNVTDTQSGAVFINTGAIEQYSYTTGKLVACLQQELYHPQGMSLTGDGNLILGNEIDVKVYELK